MMGETVRNSSDKLPTGCQRGVAKVRKGVGPQTNEGLWWWSGFRVRNGARLILFVSARFVCIRERENTDKEASRKLRRAGPEPFAVVEVKLAGPRRRCVALPRGENDHDDHEAEAPLRHASCYLDAAFGEVTAIFDLKAPFFQVSLPQGSRTSFRCRMQMGRLVEPTRPQSGIQAQPRSAVRGRAGVVGDAAAVGSRYAAPRSLKIHVWIDNI
ncbi:hypothetical protein ERJ75_000478000 [Trypanosoma vivax]|nr:hypothetical protein ERJ75_000478000 [Trypanosoma vivax]